jgi:hypothetical protein
MRNDRPIDHARRGVLGQSFRTACAAITVLAIGASRTASAKANKSDVMYQDHPHEGKRCRDCKSFIAPADQGDAARCAVVDGGISPEGWCAMFSPRG